MKNEVNNFSSQMLQFVSKSHRIQQYVIFLGVKIKYHLLIVFFFAQIICHILYEYMV